MASSLFPRQVEELCETGIGAGRTIAKILPGGSEAAVRGSFARIASRNMCARKPCVDKKNFAVSIVKRTCPATVPDNPQRPPATMCRYRISDFMPDRMSVYM